MPYDRKEIDRKFAAKRYADFKLRREKLISEIFGGECNVCKITNQEFHLHHTYYHPTESDYPRNASSLYVRIKRLKEAEQHPERFLCLCPKCHSMLEKLKRYIRDNSQLSRLVTLAEQELKQENSLSNQGRESNPQS